MSQTEQKRSFVQFAFYKIDMEWRRLPAGVRAVNREQLATVVDCFAERFMVKTYSTIGTRGDCDFLLWRASDRLENFQEMQAELLRTELGGFLQTPYSFLAMTKRSQYIERHQHEGQDGARLVLKPSGAKYLFVYPFVKTRDWYLLPKEKRQEIMSVHIEIGNRFPSVKLNTTYSFGLDDQEFVVAFETDEPADFLDLVMTLRETESSRYTLRDTPIFTCVQKPIREALALIG